MEIDLRRASFTLYRLGNVGIFAGKVGLASDVGRSSGPVTPFQIMKRASAARANRDGDKVAIFSRTCLLVALPVPPLDSSFILLTSRETCAICISGKLRFESKCV